MRICLLTAFHASWTEQEVSILSELGHTVFLLYPKRPGLYGYAKLFLKGISIFLRCDLIYCWFVFPTGVIAVSLGKVLRKHVLLNAIGSDVACVPSISYGSPSKWYFRPLVTWALKNATRVIAISQDVAKWAEKWGAQDVTVIYEGIDVEKFRPFQFKSLKRKGKHVLLTVSWLEKNNVKRKDFTTLFECLPKVVKLFSDIKLIVVGRKGDAYAFLRQMVKDLKIENNVVFKGFVPDQELLKIYNECDVFVLASLHEGFPTICAEAQACEKPVITTKASSMPEVIKNNKTGVLVEPRDPKALAEAIMWLLSNPVLRRRLGRSGRQRVIRFFSKEVRKERVQEVLATLTDYGG